MVEALATCADCGHKVALSAKACPNCGSTKGVPGGSSSGGGCFSVLGWIVGIFVLVVIAASVIPGDKTKQPDIDDIVLDAQKADNFRELITAAGYFCPRVGIARRKGVDTDGLVIKVWCGPADQPGKVFEKAVYRVTARGVKPWKD